MYRQQEAIESIDGDGSGFVDIDEFIELMRIKTKEAADEAEIKEAFRILDRDSKGHYHIITSSLSSFIPRCRETP